MPRPLHPGRPSMDGIRAELDDAIRDMQAVAVALARGGRGGPAQATFQGVLKRLVDLRTRLSTAPRKDPILVPEHD